MTAYERIWETWRSKRDVLQSTFQRLIGCKDDKSTFKEWIYESFAIPLLEKHVNAFLAESTSSALWIKIEYSSKSLGFIVFDRGNRTTFGLSSGFQQFIIGLAFRLALTRLGGSGHRFRTLIIDEGFVACDADNVQNAREILQIMMEKGGFRHILLATHLDTIKDMIGRKIHIERDGAFSKLRVGPRLELTVPIDTDKPKRGRPKKDAK
jgi:DNA repair exonuclease SbcCD ATPase subunit